jgi:CspA family cold shock protein
MKKGKIKWYNAAKGFGFIGTEEQEDIFIHRTGLLNPHERLDPDQEVVFEVKQGEKGLMAVNLKLAD